MLKSVSSYEEKILSIGTRERFNSSRRKNLMRRNTKCLDKRQKQRGESTVKTSMCLMYLYSLVAYTVHGFPQVCRLGMEALLWLHKSTESPRGHNMSIPRGSLCAGRPFHCSLCLSFLAESSLSAETHTERGDNVISGICLSISAASDCLSGRICRHWHRIPISL